MALALSPIATFVQSLLSFALVPYCVANAISVVNKPKPKTIEYVIELRLKNVDDVNPPISARLSVLDDFPLDFANSDTTSRRLVVWLNIILNILFMKNLSYFYVIRVCWLNFRRYTPTMTARKYHKIGNWTNQPKS